MFEQLNPFFISHLVIWCSSLVLLCCPAVSACFTRFSDHFLFLAFFPPHTCNTSFFTLFSFFLFYYPAMNEMKCNEHLNIMNFNIILGNILYWNLIQLKIWFARMRKFHFSEDFELCLQCEEMESNQIVTNRDFGYEPILFHSFFVFFFFITLPSAIFVNIVTHSCSSRVLLFQNEAHFWISWFVCSG